MKYTTARCKTWLEWNTWLEENNEGRRKILNLSTGVTTVKIVSQKGVHPRSTLLLPLRRISFSSEKACRCKKTNECSGSFGDKKRKVHYCRVVGRGSWFIWSLPGWIVNRERVAARRSNSKKPTTRLIARSIDKLQRL